jgi:hypothetical protein
VLSLLNADMGIVGRPFLSMSVGNNAGVRSFESSKALIYSRLQLYRLPRSMREQFALTSSARIGVEADNEQVRRIAAVALMVTLLEMNGKAVMRYPF